MIQVINSRIKAGECTSCHRRDRHLKEIVVGYTPNQGTAITLCSSCAIELINKLSKEFMTDFTHTYGKMMHKED